MLKLSQQKKGNNKIQEQKSNKKLKKKLECWFLFENRKNNNKKTLWLEELQKEREQITNARSYRHDIIVYAVETKKKQEGHIRNSSVSVI